MNKEATNVPAQAEAAPDRGAAARQTVQLWARQAEALREKYPGLDLEKESKDPRFLALLRVGLPVEQAYCALHCDELMEKAAADARAQAEKQVIDNVRAKGVRPEENGTMARGAFTVRRDVSRLGPAQRADIAKRAMMGEIIEL